MTNCYTIKGTKDFVRKARVKNIRRATGQRVDGPTIVPCPDNWNCVRADHQRVVTRR